MVIAFTTKEKAHRQQVKGFKSGLINLSELNCGETNGRVESDGIYALHQNVS
jgi:hypothetical protein